jgi:hypothetical protein
VVDAEGVDRANIINRQQVHFTTHDFRRIFATDAPASGLPPHIVQVLLGHKRIATTQGYAAVYPQDVIRLHRTWIGQRRLTRPSEEYRRPTPAEWEEFERSASAVAAAPTAPTATMNTPAAQRVTPTRPHQADRLREIIANLHARITEAGQNNWLGEVDGLKTSLAGAQEKLEEMERLTADDGPVLLGLPTINAVVHERSHPSG